MIVKLYKSRSYNRWKSYTDSRWNRNADHNAPAYRVRPDGTLETIRREPAQSGQARPAKRAQA